MHRPSVLVRKLTKNKCSPKESSVNFWLSPHFSFSAKNLSDRLQIKERWGFASSLSVSFHPSHSHSLWKSKSQCHHLQHQHHINLFCFTYININLPDPRIWFLHPLICHSWQSKKKHKVNPKFIQNILICIDSTPLLLPAKMEGCSWRIWTATTRFQIRTHMLVLSLIRATPSSPMLSILMWVQQNQYTAIGLEVLWFELIFLSALIDQLMVIILFCIAQSPW